MTLVELAAAIERIPLTTLPSSPEVRLALEARMRAWNILRHTLGVIEHAQRAHEPNVAGIVVLSVKAEARRA